MKSVKRTNKGYLGSVTVPSKDRHWKAYEGNPGQWLVGKSGGFGKIHQFKSKSEALRKIKELSK